MIGERLLLLLCRVVNKVKRCVGREISWLRTANDREEPMDDTCLGIILSWQIVVFVYMFDVDKVPGHKGVVHKHPGTDFHSYLI